MIAYLAAMHGALVAMSLLAAVFFFRQWRASRDGLFAWFAGAFLTFAVNWGLLAYTGGASEHSFHIYVVRLLGFSQIIAAILWKNRRR